MTGAGLERMGCCVKSILQISHREPKVGAKEKPQTVEEGGRQRKPRKTLELEKSDAQATVIQLCQYEMAQQEESTGREGGRKGEREGGSKGGREGQRDGGIPQAGVS